MKFKRKLKNELDYKETQQITSSAGGPIEAAPTSREYIQFKKEYLPKVLSWYEKACNMSEKILKLKPDAKEEEKLIEAIATAHLNVTPSGTLSFSILGPTPNLVSGNRDKMAAAIKWLQECRHISMDEMD